MTDLTTLRDLEKRLEEATGPDRALGFKLSIALQAPKYDGTAEQWFGNKSDPTRSIDAAIDLVERVLPDAEWFIEGPKPSVVTLHGVDVDEDLHVAASPALALCLALIRALIARGEP